MRTLTIDLPDDKYAHLEQLAVHQHISLNALMDELSTQALTEFDAYRRFLARAAQGDIQHGLELLDKLDRHYATQVQEAHAKYADEEHSDTADDLILGK